MELCDVLIVGQGLAGTWLCRALEEQGLSYRVIDAGSAASASAVASGVINPITGRRWVKTWMIDELMPFAWNAYLKMGEDLNADLISETKVIDFFPSVQMLQAFQQSLKENKAFLESGEEREKYAEWFRYELGWGSVQPVFLVQPARLVQCWRERLNRLGWIREEIFDAARLVTGEHKINYGDIEATRLVYCDGAAAADNPLFARLPFSLNKGEALIIETEAMPRDLIFKKNQSLIPWKENLWWAGSSYTWDQIDDHPTEAFRNQTVRSLTNFLKAPFRVVDHIAAVRPATLERRPFVGFHPKYSNIGIFNGLGTKGCSLAPWFAAQLALHLKTGAPVDPLADIHRFSRQLSL